jgi:hypothetical protein
MELPAPNPVVDTATWIETPQNAANRKQMKE